MPCKIVCPPSSNPAYPAILVPEVINPRRELLAMLAVLCKIVCPPSSNPTYPAILIPEAINSRKELLVMHGCTLQNRVPFPVKDWEKELEKNAKCLKQWAGSGQ